MQNQSTENVRQTNIQTKHSAKETTAKEKIEATDSSRREWESRKRETGDDVVQCQAKVCVRSEWIVWCAGCTVRVIY